MTKGSLCTIFLVPLSQERIKLESSLLLKGGTNRASPKPNFCPWIFSFKAPNSTSPLMVACISSFPNVYPFRNKYCIACFPVALEIYSKLSIAILAIYNALSIPVPFDFVRIRNPDAIPEQTCHCRKTDVKININVAIPWERNFLRGWNHEYPLLTCKERSVLDPFCGCTLFYKPALINTLPVG